MRTKSLFLKATLICFVFSFLLGVGLRSTFAADRPNIVWFISEDNSKHFTKLFDETGAAMPNIERLAQSGLIFEHAFSNSPVCSVARTTLMTSCYGPRIGTQFHRRSKMVPMPEGLEMFPVYLRKAGYYTTNKQKTDYNAIPGKEVWDESSRRATWRKRKKDQPFFHMQSFGTTHEGTLHFSESNMKNNPTKTDPKSVFVPPHHPQTDTFKYTYARYHDNIQSVDAQIGKEIEKLKADGLMDDTFIFYFGDHGGVLPRGKGYVYETGLHVPLVVHVPKNFRHLAGTDFKPEVDGTRVNGFVSFVDFGPTVLSLAGVDLPEGIDGKPFLADSQSIKELNRHQTTFGYADRFDEKYDFVRTWRKGRYKYIRNFQPFNFDGLQNNYRYKMLAYQQWRKLYQRGELNAAQKQFFETRPAESLFDIQSDPYEINDLSQSKEHQGILMELRQELHGHLKSIRDLSLFHESHLYDHAFENPVKYGKEHGYEIAGLVDVAAMSLKPYEQVKTKLRGLVASKNSNERYWAWIVLSCFGKQASEMGELAEKMSREDSDNLVKVRAAEFMGIAKTGDPVAPLTQSLYESKNPVEATLIFNTIVLLRDGFGYQFKLDPKRFDLNGKAYDNVKRRFEYFMQEEPKN